jgi:hypothetical protein
MYATLRDRLIQAEQRFLIAVVANDEAALKGLSQEWYQLTRHLEAVEASGDLDNDTALLLSHVSRVIKATEDCILECDAISDDAQSCLINSPAFNLPWDNIPAVSTSPSSFPSYRLLFSRASSSGTLGILGQNKLLDSHAYHWLMQNMQSPYPAPSQMQTICEESMTSVSQAELWFQEVRDLIGWTRLSHIFFGGSVDATINAAKRAYLGHDNAIPFGIAFNFAAVKASMEALFLEYPASLARHVGHEAQTLRSVPSGQDQHFKEESTADSDCTFKITNQHNFWTSRRWKKRTPRHHPRSPVAKGISLRI